MDNRSSNHFYRLRQENLKSGTSLIFLGPLDLHRRTLVAALLRRIDECRLTIGKELLTVVKGLLKEPHGLLPLFQFVSPLRPEAVGLYVSGRPENENGDSKL